MITLAFNTTVASFANMIIFSMGVLLFRGIKFPPGNFEFFLLVMLSSSVINAVISPNLIKVRIPRLFLLPIIAVTGLNFGIMTGFEAFSDGALVIDSTMWLVAFSAFIGIITGFLSRAAHNLKLVKTRSKLRADTDKLG